MGARARSAPCARAAAAGVAAAVRRAARAAGAAAARCGHRLAAAYRCLACGTRDRAQRAGAPARCPGEFRAGVLPRARRARRALQPQPAIRRPVLPCADRSDRAAPDRVVPRLAGRALHAVARADRAGGGSRRDRAALSLPDQERSDERVVAFRSGADAAQGRQLRRRLGRPGMALGHRARKVGAAGVRAAALVGRAVGRAASADHRRTGLRRHPAVCALPAHAGRARRAGHPVAG